MKLVPSFFHKRQNFSIENKDNFDLLSFDVAVFQNFRKYCFANIRETKRALSSHKFLGNLMFFFLAINHFDRLSLLDLVCEGKLFASN